MKFPVFNLQLFARCFNFVRVGKPATQQTWKSALLVLLFAQVCGALIAAEIRDDFSDGAATWVPGAGPGWSVVQTSPGVFAYRGDLSGDALTTKTNVSLGSAWQLGVDIFFRRLYADNSNRGVMSWAIFPVDSGVQLEATMEYFSSGVGRFNVSWFDPTNRTWRSVLESGNLSGYTPRCHLDLARTTGSDRLTFTVTSTNGSSYRGETAAIPLAFLNRQRYPGLRANYAQVDFSNFIYRDYVAGFPPAISLQPLNQTVAAGTTVTLRAAASGSAPLVYQWFKDGTNLPSATSSNLLIRGVGALDAGRYFFVATNTYGSSTSRLAILSVLLPPQIVVHPQNRTVTTGENVEFLVEASGTIPLTYVWRKNGFPIPGAVFGKLVITNAQPTNAASYTVVVANSLGSVISQPAVLTILEPSQPPSITSQPRPLALRGGESGVLSVAALGTAPLSYQWFRAPPGATGGVPVGGATNASLTVVGEDGVFYWVTISNPAGSVTSDLVRITLVSSNSARLALGFVSGLPALTIDGPVELTWRIEHCATLTSTNWKPLLELTLPNAPFTFIDSTALSTPARFYRVVTLP